MCSLVSCGPRAYLVTDPSFRAAAPEVVEAWRTLWPLHDSQTIELAASERSLLVDTLESLPNDAPVLVGASINTGQKRDLAGLYSHLVFLGPPISGVRTIGIDRSAAWTLVAQKALSSEPAAPAWVIFPTDVTPRERADFQAAWSPSGQALVAWVWPLTGDSAPDHGPVFQWAGQSAAVWIEGLAPARSVHANPGLGAPPGSEGYTWRIITTGLGEFLWRAVVETPQKVNFLPLETVHGRR